MSEPGKGVGSALARTRTLPPKHSPIIATAAPAVNSGAGPSGEGRCNPRPGIWDISIEGKASARGDMEDLRDALEQAKAGDVGVERFQDMAMGYSYSILGDWPKTRPKRPSEAPNLYKVYAPEAFPRVQEGPIQTLRSYGGGSDCSRPDSRSELRCWAGRRPSVDCRGTRLEAELSDAISTARPAITLFGLLSTRDL